MKSKLELDYDLRGKAAFVCLSATFAIFIALIKFDGTTNQRITFYLTVALAIIFTLMYLLIVATKRSYRRLRDKLPLYPR